MTYKELDAQYFMPCFGRSMQIVKGEGCTVFDDEGKSYLDSLQELLSAVPVTATRKW